MYYYNLLDIDSLEKSGCYYYFKCHGRLFSLEYVSNIDKDDIFMHISVHHVVQMVIALLIIFIIGKTKKLKFHLKNKIKRAVDTTALCFIIT